MFKELIAQGEDMIRRLEAHVGLTHADRVALPAYRQVSTKEANAWDAAVEARIKGNFGADTIRRFDMVRELYREELDRDAGDEITRALNAWHRIVVLLTELDGRKEVGASSIEPRPSQAPPEDHAYDFFISHASEDKDAVARPLHDALTKAGVSVWFDEATLELGDSLRKSIDKGLARCRYGVVILSPHFLAKRWPQLELDGLFARETVTGEKAILPVWHQMDAATLAQHSPMLADRLAARADDGIAPLAEQLIRILRR